MFDSGDEAYLLRALGKNSIVLFLGAGFSSGAKNSLNQPLPTGAELATLMWELLDSNETYDGSPLGDIYEAVLSSGIPHSTIRNFLEKHLLCRDVPDEYHSLGQAYWYRIYTTNIDDLVTRIYAGTGSPRLSILAFPNDDIAERDPFLEELQLIHLNGRLPCGPNDVTFSPRQYAAASNASQPLYQEFVRDYATRPTIFLGSQLNEPLFWQHIEARQGRFGATTEQRPKSFLIARSISITKRQSLERFNVVPVTAETSDFLSWLKDRSPGLPQRRDILAERAPWLAEEFSSGTGGTPPPEMRQFAESFTRVPLSRNVAETRSLYLLGAAPRWEDLFRGLDAPREITDSIFEFIEGLYESETPMSVVALLGSAGGGKSTILRRLGIRLAQSGRAVYLTNSEEVPTGLVIRKALEFTKTRATLLFDNAEATLGAIPGIFRSLAPLTPPPVVVIASRTNDFDRLFGRIGKNIGVQEFQVPHLNRVEIVSVLKVLDQNDLLGNLRGLNPQERIREFENRAQKQILVAMREATSGHGFDQIIEDEFNKLTPAAAKVLYLCVALATDAGYRITKEEFVGSSPVAPAETLHILNRNLHDVVIPTGLEDNLLLLRHRLIAEHMVQAAAPRPLLREAYVRLLNVLASKIGGNDRRTRIFKLYRDLINHQTIYRRFSEDIDEARSIYMAVAPQIRNDTQFWLQFGSLELEGRGGSLDFAENYLSQAESLSPDDRFVRNAKGHLLIRKGVYASDYRAAARLRDEGSELLLSRIEESSSDDEYAVHIYCSQRYRFINKWFGDDDEAQRVELEHLREVSRRGTEKHPRHRKLRRLHNDIERAYLELGIPRNERPKPPIV